MPLKPINYSNTTFYRIVCNDLNIKDCYIGHTTNFIKRKQQHKQHCNNKNLKDSHYKVYQYIREHGGWNNWSMIMIEQISCENVYEAVKIERKFLEEYNGTLNGQIPSRTKKEYTNDTKEIKKIYDKCYLEKNKDIINEKRKIKIICDCGIVSTNRNMARHKKSKFHQDFIKNNISINNING